MNRSSEKDMNQGVGDNGQLWQEDHGDGPGADSGQGSSTPDEGDVVHAAEGQGSSTFRSKKGKTKWTRLDVHIVVRGREERQRGRGGRGGRGRQRRPAPSGEGTHAGSYSNMMANVARQLEYYFSRGNLLKDVFLRRHMNVDGWVHVSIIAGFPRMGSLIRRAPTDPVTQEVIMQAAQLTDQVTVSDDLQWLRPVDLADQWRCLHCCHCQGLCSQLRTSSRGDSCQQRLVPLSLVSSGHPKHPECHGRQLSGLLKYAQQSRAKTL